jgi:hypothetical protein
MKAQKYEGRLKGRTATDWEEKSQAGLAPGSLYLAQLQEYQRTMQKTQ